MDFERLGAFYLGKEHADGETQDRLVMYDARDLTTHAVCIGMTGSGKTGLCVDLLEEAALDRVPALIIDPKGDITNLLLTFPELRPEDFRPWINPDDARRKGMEPDDFAAAQAELWRDGLAGWGQDGERIANLRDTTDFAVYTPGSDAGLPVSMLSSLTAPAVDWEEDAEYVREQIGGMVSGLLGLIGVEADPVQSREHILLANLFEHFWRQGKNLDLESLILAIQDPPVRRLGVFDVDTFFPQKERTGLAMKLNNLVASPGFQSWLEGQPLDIPSFLHATDGRPRHSVFYIAHLSDAERMFFVTMLLNQVVTWMRAQPGTTSLRALLYMDEIFGFLPPVAEPPSKRPFLTLFKQARAYGLGVVLTTQNPVDLDYKALTNAGTWFIGRLQTERDKMRVLEGLQAASTDAGQALSRAEIDRLISGLDKRVFLLHNVHEDAPLTFKTRWAMSYLRGPLTRVQVGDLMEGRAPDFVTAPSAAPADPVAAGLAHPSGAMGQAKGSQVADGPPEGLSSRPPVLGSEVRQTYLPLLKGPTSAAVELEQRHGGGVRIEGQQLVYMPGVVGSGRVHFFHRKSGAEASEAFTLLAGSDAQGLLRWDDATSLASGPDAWSEAPEAEAWFGVVPETFNQSRELTRARGDLADYLYRSRSLSLLHSPDVGAFSTPGETPQEFRARLVQAARERRDEAVDKLEDRYAKRIAALEERLRKARSALAKREADAAARTRETVVSVGETVLGLFLGRRSSRAASSSLSKYRMRSSARMRAEEAEENVEALQASIQEMEDELRQETVDLTAVAWTPMWRVGFRVGDGPVEEATIVAY
jgi:DNA helicase HerA-like ATPase